MKNRYGMNWSFTYEHEYFLEILANIVFKVKIEFQGKAINDSWWLGTGLEHFRLWFDLKLRNCESKKYPK